MYYNRRPMQQQIGTRLGGCDMRPCRIIQITDYHKTNIFVGEIYSTICVEWTGDHFGLGLTKKICAKNDFYIFVPSDIDDF